MMRQIAIAVIFLSFFVIVTTFAQGQGTNVVAQKDNSTPITILGDQPISASNTNILNWAKENPVDWASGVIFAVSGMIGALVIIFGLIGAAVPGTVGQVDIDAETERLKNLCQKQDTMLKGEFKVEEARAIQEAISSLRDSLSKEKWRQFSLATFLYVIIGAFFAMFLAQDALQALLIGAGWTGLVGSLGLKNDSEARGSRKNDTISNLMKQTAERDDHIKALEVGLDKLLKANKERDERINDLESKLPENT